MHLPGGVLDNITCAVSTAASAGAIGYSVYRLHQVHRLRPEAVTAVVPKAAAVAAMVFAAQMVNYPIHQEISGHLVGGTLAAALLGPWAGLLAMSLVLAGQYLLAGDGAAATLGANVLNMGVVTVWLGYAVLCSLRRTLRAAAISEGTASSLSAAAAAFISILAASALCAVELAFSGGVPLRAALVEIASGHLGIGVVEAMFTGISVGLVVVMRPDSVAGQARNPQSGSFSPAASVACLLLALGVTLFLAPWASTQPDGLETALGMLVPEKMALATATECFAPLADYTMPGVSHPVLSTALAGTAGALSVYGMAWIAGLGLRLSIVSD